MILDARTAAVGPRLNARIAVIGGGAAGIMLARRLAGKMDGVVLVESGGRAQEGPTQRLTAGRSIGIPYYDLMATRLRFYGGTTNHWSGYCRIAQPFDHEARPDLGILPWPISLEQLRPYLAEAGRTLAISTDFENIPAIFRQNGFDPSQMIENRKDYSGALDTRLSQIVKFRKLGPVTEASVAALPGLRRVFYLNAVDIVQAGKRIDHIKARTLDGKQVEVRADAYVIACHGIENARLLLESTSASPNGIGNQHGNVGRHFSEHFLVPYAKLLPSEAFPPLYDETRARATGVRPQLSISPDLMKKEGTLNAFARFFAYNSAPGTREALLALRRSVLQPFSAQVMADLRAAMQDPGGALNELAGSLNEGWKQPYRYDCVLRVEQAPNPLSRVVLSNRRNALGQREADLDWQINALDLHTVNVARDTMVREISAMGMGRMQLLPLERKDIEASMEGTHHQMGTTRMAQRPQDGVVDFDGRVHQVDNLYMAGSSVFPHPGDAGPTMTLMAMALRLGDHLMDRYA